MDDSNPLDLLDYLRIKGVARARDVEAIGIPRKYLSRLAERGQAERIGRGLYMAADAEWEPHHSLAAVAARVPHGVVCLLSALLFHCLLYTSDAADDLLCVDLGGRRIIKKK